MAKTTFSGPVLVGNQKDTTNSFNLGTTVLQQDVVFTPSANIVTYTDADGGQWSYYNKVPATAWAGTAAAVTASIYLPANAQIIGLYVDVLATIVGPTALSVTAGVTANGTDYMNVTGLMTGPVTGRTIPTYTNAQCLAMMNITTNTTLYVQAVPTVAAVSAGSILVQVQYTLTPA